jgi:hypothetical protein
MATADVMHDGKVIFALDPVEQDTVRLHSDRNSLSLSNALADIVERGLQSVAEEILQESADTTLCPDACMGMVTCSIQWPTDGPYCVFDEADKKFAASVLAMSLREALTVMLYKKMNKET